MENEVETVPLLSEHGGTGGLPWGRGIADRQRASGKEGWLVQGLDGTKCGGNSQQNWLGTPIDPTAPSCELEKDTPSICSKQSINIEI